MLNPLFWVAFLATFFVLKALADAWLDLPVPTARRRTVVGEPSVASGPEPGLSLRPAA